MDEVEHRPRSRRSSEMSEEDVQRTIMIERSMECEALSGRNAQAPDPVGIDTAPARPEKRLRNDSDEREIMDEDGFTLVQRKPKRIAINQNKLINKRVTNVLLDKNQFEVCLSSNQILPKQIGLAKLLSAENIANVNRIKYKTPYKVLIYFDSEERANQLINNKTLLESGYRCFSTSEVSITYGIVKYLELDVKDEDLIKYLHCEQEIVSVKRLKRMSETGQWVDSETVRFGFKSSSLPPYVYGYGSRFKVEHYVFPVTQCYACWKFGHLTRTCPEKRVICPKCGEKHPNCETTEFRCVNCKGEHASFDKSCPMYVKEREIRSIMSTENCTYKIALIKYLQRQASRFNNISGVRINDTAPVYTFGNKEYNMPFQESGRMLYSQSVTKSFQKNNLVDDSENESKESSEDCLVTTEHIIEKKKKNKKQNQKKQKATTCSIEPQPSSSGIKVVKERDQLISDNDKKKEPINNLVRIFNRAKEIVLSDKSFEEKICEVVQLIFKELMSFVVKTMSNNEGLSKVMSLFNYG